MPEVIRGKEALVVGKAQPRSTREKSGQHPDLFGTFLIRYCEILIAAIFWCKDNNSFNSKTRVTKRPVVMSCCPVLVLFVCLFYYRHYSYPYFMHYFLNLS